VPLHVCLLSFSLAVQAALQPWSASIYTQLLQHGRQPDLTFTTLPQALFRAAQPATKAAGPTATPSSSRTAGGVQRPPAVSDVGLTSSFSLRSSSTVFKRPGTTTAGGPAARPQLRTSSSCTSGTAAAAAAAAPEGALLFEEVRLRYEGSGSIVLGYYHSSADELVLNPAKGAWCEPGDVLVTLTRTAGERQAEHNSLSKHPARS
jgi:hypothetical protein